MNLHLTDSPGTAQVAAIIWLAVACLRLRCVPLNIRSLLHPVLACLSRRSPQAILDHSLRLVGILRTLCFSQLENTPAQQLLRMCLRIFKQMQTLFKQACHLNGAGGMLMTMLPPRAPI